MTIQEMHLAFDTVVDIIATQGYVGAEPEEKDFFLNRAIERFVKNRFTGNNNLKLAFQQHEKRFEDLRTIIYQNFNTAVTAINQSSDPSIWSYTLPDTIAADPKYLFHLTSSANIDKDECGNTVTSRKIKTKLMTHDQKEEFLDDPFHTSDYNEVLFLIEGSVIYLFTNNLYNILSYNMTYIGYPAIVRLAVPSIDCDLPTHTHQEIVDMAAQLYIVGINDANRAALESQIIKGQE